MTNSKRVGWSIGSLPGSAPFRILTTYGAARRHNPVGKDKAGLPTLMGNQQPCLFGLFQGVEQVSFFVHAKRRQEIKAKHPTDAGGGGQDALRSFTDAVDAAPEH